MATYGGWNGLAEGLKSGMALGQNAAEIRLKRQALLNEQVDSKIELTAKSVQNGLQILQDMYDKAPNRTPALEQSGNAFAAHLEDTAKALAALGTPKAQAASQNLIATVQAVKSNLHTANEQYAAKQKGELQGKIDFVNEMSPPDQGASPITLPTPTPQAAPGDNQQVASATMPGQMPQAAPALPDQAQVNAPGPLPDQTLPWLQPSQPGLGATAQAAPPTPMPVATPDQGQPQPQPQPMPAPGQQAPSGQDELRQRLLDQVFPPTDEQKAITSERVKSFYKFKDTANDAAVGLAGIARAQQLIKEGIYSGGMASSRLELAKDTGMGDTAKIQRTEEFMSIMREQVLKNIRPLGTNTAVSENDRKFITEMVGADINLNPGSIDNILKHGKSAFKSILDRYNKDAPKYGEEPMPIPSDQEDQNAGDTGGVQDTGFKADKEGWITLGPGIRMRAIPNK